MTIGLYLGRHGLTVQNKKQIVQGQQPGELTRRGRKKSKTLGEILKDIKFDKVWSSDLARALETKNLVLPQLVYMPAVVEVTADLRERGFGHMEGMTYKKAGIADIPAEEIYAIDQEGIFYDIEPLSSVRERVQRIKKRILLCNRPKNLVIAHEWLNSYLMNDLLSEEISRETFHPQKNCSVSFFMLDGQGNVLEYEIGKYEISD